ncbi:Ctr copper transporter family-domain-containing protein [Chlamydoabsidia padenii]|nr:Ctr copper transporter family-domain-containing protein [Chlamydoabsidia padenii]
MDHSQHHGSMPPMQHGHEGHDMSQCSMNMIFNWQIKDVCVVFESWHIETGLGMVLSCVGIFVIAAGYEYLRVWTANLDREVALADVKRQVDGTDNDILLSQSLEQSNSYRRQQMLRSTMYATLMAISFWLMLVFMTYNGYLMIALILGAGVGHYMFGQGKLAASRNISCH